MRAGAFPFGGVRGRSAGLVMGEYVLGGRGHTVPLSSLF